MVQIQAYLDESGLLGDKNVNISLISILIITEKESLKLKNIKTKLRRKYKRELKITPEIKFYKHTDEFIELALNNLNKLDFKAYTIVIDKKQYSNKLLLKENHYNDIYIDMVIDLLEKINLNQSFIFRLDKSLPKRDREKLTKLILKNPKIKINKSRIFHDESFKYLGLQFVDLIAGSCFQSLQKNNPKFIEIIENKHTFFKYTKQKLKK
jgi:hypothetical protein